jgi:hypothetical protein
MEEGIFDCGLIMDIHNGLDHSKSPYSRFVEGVNGRES